MDGMLTLLWGIVNAFLRRWQLLKKHCIWMTKLRKAISLWADSSYGMIGILPKQPVDLRKESVSITSAGKDLCIWAPLTCRPAIEAHEGHMPGIGPVFDCSGNCKSETNLFADRSAKFFRTPLSLFTHRVFHEMSKHSDIDHENTNARKQ